MMSKEFASSSFGRAGYEVRVAADAEQAMAICQSERFNVLLSDVVMPGRDGHELARWIAAHDPSTRTVLMPGHIIPHRNGLFTCPFAAGV